MNKTTPSPENQVSVRDKVLARLSDEHVTPYSRRVYLWREYLIWLTWLFTVVIGGISFSLLLYSTMYAGYEFFMITHSSLSGFILSSLPYWWILLFIIFLWLANLNLRVTKRGYRYPIWQLVGSSVLLTVALGAVLHLWGANQRIDRILGAMPMPYLSVDGRQENMWIHPEAGRLTGKFMKNTDIPDVVIFKDVAEKEWSVNTGELMPVDEARLLSGKRVRLLGEAGSTTENSFHTCGVLPWRFTTHSWSSYRETRNMLVEYESAFSLHEPETADKIQCHHIMRSLLRVAKE